MNMSELREVSALDVKKLLIKKQEELRDLTFKVSEAQLAQIHTIKATKREIAQLLTALREKNNVA